MNLHRSLIIYGAISFLFVTNCYAAERQLLSLREAGGNARTSVISQEQCASVDLSQDPRFPKIRNQGGTTYCTAYSMADLIGFHENKHISAIDLALNTRYYQHRGKNLQFIDLYKRLNSGDQYSPVGAFSPGEVMEFINKQGFCLEERARSTSSTKLFSDPVDAYQHIWDMTWVGREARKAFLPRLQTLKPVNQDQYWHSVRNEVNRTCGPRRRLSGPLALDYREAERNSLSELVGSLDSTRPSFVVLSNSHLSASGNGYHAVLLVGRRWKNGTCEYILRDSTGPNCEGFRNTHLKCENGHVIIETHSLAKAITATATITAAPDLALGSRGPATRQAGRR